MTNPVVCTSDRYTQEREKYASVEEFRAMCAACFGEAPELRQVGDEWHDDDGVVLVEVAIEYAADAISLNNGNSVTTVADLDDAQVSHAFDCLVTDDRVEAAMTGPRETAREWLASYCDAHQRACGELLVIG